VYRFPKSTHTDHFVTLKSLKTDEIPVPKRILIVSPTSHGLDSILDKLDKNEWSKSVKIVRVGKSHHREDLNDKYTINLSEEVANDKIRKTVETQSILGEA
jgi:hypothetical protein